MPPIRLNAPIGPRGCSRAIGVKPINSVLTHKTRGNKAVRDFMKVVCSQLLPDDQEEDWVDPELLARLLTPLNSLEPQWVKNHFWSLARAFGPGVWPKLYLDLQLPVLDDIHALLSIYGPAPLRQSIRLNFQPEPELISRLEQKTLPVRPSIRIKRLEDALANGWSFIAGSPAENPEPRSQKIIALATKAYEASQEQQISQEDQHQKLVSLLMQALQWQGSGQPPFDQLASDLLAGQTCQKDREQRRMMRLKGRLAKSPVVFVGGETGTGKSYFSARMARQTGPVFILSVGPSTEEQDVIQGWQWQDNKDNSDRSMVRRDKKLLAWASAKTASDQYVILVINEGNLSRHGLLSTLKGLWLQPPCIYCDGHQVPVSDRHRVILTGNPSSYSGRQLDSTLLTELQYVYYPPLDQSFLQDRVVEPTLLDLLGCRCPETSAMTLAQNTASNVMALWPHYKKLLPERVFTPRDLTDICSWINWYLNGINGTPTQAQLNALLLQSFRDVLGYECQELTDTLLMALETWFARQVPVDLETLESIRQQVLNTAHLRFLECVHATCSDFDTSPAATVELAQAIEQDLSRRQLALQNQKPHGGRQATLIEGPTGRGKDVTLQLVIKSFLEADKSRTDRENLARVSFISARDCPWDKLCEHIHKARREGSLLVISEMNLLESQHLEGEMNDILAGDATPGFHLFATVNPVGYAGRNPLSPALLGRFRRIPIRAYTQQELASIAARVLPGTASGKARAYLLAEWHCRMRETLQGKGIAMLPTSQELKSLAAAVRDINDETALKKAFEQHYRFYFLAAKISLDDLLTQERASQPDDSCERALTQWLNQQSIVELDKPYRISRGGTKSHINPDQGLVVVARHADHEEAKQVIIRLLVQAQWQVSGMPLECPEKQDQFKQTFYTFWQQTWARKTFPALSPDILFPFDAAQKRTLELPGNKPYQREVNNLMKQQVDCSTLQWPELWQKIERILDSPAASFHDNKQGAPAISTPIAKEKEKEKVAAPPVLMPKPVQKKLDNRTGFRQRSVPSSGVIPQIFDINADRRMFRVRVYDVEVTINGVINEIRCGRGEYGLEAIQPKSVKAGANLVLNQRQVCGASQITIKETATQYFYLPGLQADDTLVALRTEPETGFEVVRDRYTGLHMIALPNSKIGESVTVHYVLETRKPRSHLYLQNKKTACIPAPSPVRPDASPPDTARSVIETALQSGGTEFQPIISAIDPARRVAAITHFCEAFQGNYDPEPTDKNFLLFLLTQRQGTCRHRTPVFVLLCRFYGIPARMVKSQTHSFPEYSLDNGHTWQAQDLGGAPAHFTVNPRSDFPPQQQGEELNKQLTSLLQTLDDSLLQKLADTMGVPFEQLLSAVQAGLALPRGSAINDISYIVKRLWDVPAISTLKMGADLLETTENLSSSEAELLGKYQENLGARMQPLSRAITAVWQSGEKESRDVTLRILEDLQAKAKQMEISKGWGALIATTLHDYQYEYDCRSEANQRKFVDLAQWIMQKNWLLDVAYCRYSSNILSLLHMLKRWNRLNPLAMGHLEGWYRRNLKKDLTDHHLIQCLSCKPLPVEIRGSHNGHSLNLEAQIKAAEMDYTWSDVPEGIPEIERMLTGQRAFPVSGSKNNKGRPVIWLVAPGWHTKTFETQVQALENLYGQETEDEKCRMKGFEPSSTHMICRQALSTAFLSYLYQCTQRNNSSLILGWIDFLDNRRIHPEYEPGGSCKIHSFQQLSRLVIQLDGSQQVWTEDKPHIRRAFNTPDALVLMPEDMAVFVDDFMASLDINSLYQEFKSRLMTAVDD